MLTTVEGVFDGQRIELLERVPFKNKKKVLITFLDDMLPEREPTPTQIDPIQALRGSAKTSHLTEKLLKTRKEDKVLEYSTRRK